MRTLGVVAEYNPFHNGHKLHLQTAKKELCADYCVIVMSGNFVQRGEPAIVDKWRRTEMCLRGGADLVIELPVYYSTASAEYFAEGAIKLLNAANIIDFISFGIESSSISVFKQTLDYILDEPPEYKNLLKSALMEGNSFPRARAKALAELCPANPDVYETPNNILAMEYLKALKKLKSPIIPHAITRNTNHNSDIPGKRFSSASAIRKAITSGKFWEIRSCLPRETLKILDENPNLFPFDLDDYSDILLYKIKFAPDGWLKGIFDVSEGLENRIPAAADNDTIRSIISQIKTKRYTFTKIQRILMHILLEITTQDIKVFEKNGGPQYIRVLGFKRSSASLVKELSENASLPLIFNLKKDMAALDDISLKMLEKEIMSTDVYFIKCAEQPLRRKGVEYTFPIVCV